MEHVLFALELLCPVFFLAIGRSLKGTRRRTVVNESLCLLCAVLIFSPIFYRHLSLAEQGSVCAAVFLIQFFLLALSEIQQKKPL